MGFQVKKAVREKIYPKIALMAPSGGGKTYSSLRLATGMAEEFGHKITFIKYFKVAFPLMILTILICTVYIYLRYMI
jgi:ATP-dependent protease HslVU (ClpYQ) ATPase subunit